MRPAPAALSVLTALAVIAAADPASAATAQTAKDLTVKKKDVTGGFDRTIAPGLKKGPVTAALSCAKIKLVPKGGTISTEEFEREVSESADHTQLIADDLTLTTVLTPTVAAATAIIKGIKAGDKHCGIRVGTAPTLKNATASFRQTQHYDGTTQAINNVDVPVSGVREMLIVQRGRALAFISEDRLQIVATADRTQVISISLVTSSDTKKIEKAYAKLAIKALGAQTVS